MFNVFLYHFIAFVHVGQMYNFFVLSCLLLEFANVGLRVALSALTSLRYLTQNIVR